MDNTQTQKAHKRERVLVDVIVVADLSGMCWPHSYGNSTTEQWAKYLDVAVKDFDGFLRDHRSQDMLQLRVQRKYAELCSACEQEWETDYQDGMKICANCGAELIEGEEGEGGS